MVNQRLCNVHRLPHAYSLHSLWRLSLLIFLLNSTWSSDFVKMSVMLFFSLIQHTNTLLTAMTSCTQWILMLMCFVLAWNSEFLIKASDSSESVFIVTVHLYLFSLSSSYCSQTASLVATDKAVYSVSVEKRVMIDWYLNVWLMTPSLKKKM